MARNYGYTEQQLRDIFGINRGSGDDDHGWANPAIQAEHKAKMDARQQQKDGRIYSPVSSDGGDLLFDTVRKHAQPDADKLHRLSPTRANFTHVQPSSWNIEKIKHITFTADRVHGFPCGKVGKVEILDDYRVRIHR